MATVRWQEALRVERDRETEEELRRRRGAALAERPVRVTELIEPRAAYWRDRAPAPPSPERRRAQSRGRRLHARIGSALAAPEQREVRVRRSGIIGQVDVVADRPTELKTSESMPDPDRVLDLRPQYVEQLAAYCGLLDRADGRLLLVTAVDEAPVAGSVVDLTFRSPARLLAEAETRANALRRAITRQDPTDLPRCPWYGRGCEFGALALCDCRGTEPEAGPGFLAEVTGIAPNEQASADLAVALEALRDPVGGPTVDRFRDLLYPRRAYFERTEPGRLDDVAPPGSQLPRDTLYGDLMGRIESGPTGEVTRLHAPTGDPPEAVPCWRDRPFLLKVSRSPRPADPAELVTGQPQYILELGLRCAAVGIDEGHLIVGYSRLDEATDGLRAFRVRFAPLARWEEFAEERLSSFGAALARSDPTALPACPAWMARDCPYGDRCGCAGATGGPANR